MFRYKTLTTTHLHAPLSGSRRFLRAMAIALTAFSFLPRTRTATGRPPRRAHLHRVPGELMAHRRSTAKEVLRHLRRLPQWLRLEASDVERVLHVLRQGAGP